MQKNVTADRHHVISQKTSFEVSAVAQQKILFFQYMTLHHTVIWRWHIEVMDCLHLRRSVTPSRMETSTKETFRGNILPASSQVFELMNLRTLFFWHCPPWLSAHCPLLQDCAVASSSQVNGPLMLEDEATAQSWMTGQWTPSDGAQYPRTMDFSTPHNLWTPYIFTHKRKAVLSI